MISAGRGADVVKAGAGDDFLCGGPGRDKLLGGPGVDTCNGGPGKDKLRGCEPGGGPPLPPGGGPPQPPTANPDSFDAIGNTGLFVGTTRPAGEAGKQMTGSLLANDTDPDTPTGSLVAEPMTNAPTDLGGTVTVEADGNFSYQPDDADSGGVVDTFTYRVCDLSPCNSGTTGSPYCDRQPPDRRSGLVCAQQRRRGDGTSDGPFDTLAEAEASSGAGDTVFVFDGDNTSTGYGGDGYAIERRRAADRRARGPRCRSGRRRRTRQPNAVPRKPWRASDADGDKRGRDRPRRRQRGPRFRRRPPGHGRRHRRARRATRAAARPTT